MSNMLTTNASLDAANSHNPKQRKKRAWTTRRECTHQSGRHSGTLFHPELTIFL